MQQKTAFLDSSFLLAFANPSDRLHTSARDYFQYFMGEGVGLQVSAIALAEYSVRGNVANLPMRNFRLISFTPRHASATGANASQLFQARLAGSLTVSQRVVIPNDAKLFSQAVEEGSTYLVTGDSDMQKIFNILTMSARISLSLVDISAPYDQHFGLLPLSPPPAPLIT